MRSGKGPRPHALKRSGAPRAQNYFVSDFGAGFCTFSSPLPSPFFFFFFFFQAVGNVP